MEESRGQGGDAGPGSGDEEAAGVRRELESAQRRIEELERDRAIDEELLALRPIDPGAARVLLRADLTAGDGSIAAAARAMKQKRPWLFESAGGRAAGGHNAPVMGASGPPEEETARLAEEARRTGDTRAVLRYLRARRGR